MLRPCAAAAVLLFAVPSPPAVADDPPAPEKDKVKMDPKTKEAVDRALRWLATQQAGDGSWGNTAITSFALLAFMANGHVPNQGIYGPEKLKNAASAGNNMAGDGGFIHLRKREREKVQQNAEAQFPAEFRELIKQYNINIKNNKPVMPAAPSGR